MKDSNKEANAALEAATSRVNDGRYTGREQAMQEVELHVLLATAHAQMAIARQAEIKNLLQVRRDFAEFTDVSQKVNDRLLDLLGL